MTTELQHLGPSMQLLTEKQRGFVAAMIEQGGLNYKEAARRAGYGGNDNVLRTTGHDLAHNPRIQEAIREVGLKMLTSGSLVAVKAVLEIAGDITAEKKDRLKAAEIIMNRCGMPALTEQKMTVVHKDETSAEMIKQIEQLSKNLGLDPRKLLGRAVVDAEFEEVEEADENSIDDLL
jgi:phage terminase small subunit